MIISTVVAVDPAIPAGRIAARTAPQQCAASTLRHPAPVSRCGSVCRRSAARHSRGVRSRALADPEVADEIPVRAAARSWPEDTNVAIAADHESFGVPAQATRFANKARLRGRVPQKRIVESLAELLLRAGDQVAGKSATWRPATSAAPTLAKWRFGQRPHPTSGLLLGSRRPGSDRALVRRLCAHDVAGPLQHLPKSERRQRHAQ